MSRKKEIFDTCGCCEGVRSFTPASVKNRPGLSALVYRVGTHGSFKTTMQSALSGQRVLRALSTRDTDDPSIALLDAWAIVLDVLSFYQERIANEGYLRTATERMSLLELARLIGYELNPGVAASTYLTFKIDEPPKVALPAEVKESLHQAFAQTVPSQVTIGLGTKVQSIPGQNELPQTFETVEEIEARAEWNELKPRATTHQEIGRGITKLYLKGTDTQLQPGDAILLVGNTRLNSPLSERWDFRFLETVVTDVDNNHTLVTWKEDLGHQKPTVEPADNPRVYAFRQRAALFGHNAPDWRSMSKEIKKAYAGTDWERKRQWPGFRASENYRIFLDAAYPKIIEGSWIVLLKPGYAELYKATHVEIDSQTDFTLTSKTSRIDLDTTEHLSWFYQNRRDTVVFAQSELLELADKPDTTPVFGDRIVLDQFVEGLEQGRTLILSGKKLRYVKVAGRTRVVRVGKEEVTETEEPLFLVSADGAQRVGLESGNVLEVVDAPSFTSSGSIRWHLKDENGFYGFVTAEADDFVPEQKTEGDAVTEQLGPASEDNGLVSEVVTLDKTEADGESTTLVLTTSLQNVYHRESVKINANVARGTHGETVQEVLGSGDGSKIFQKFILKQKPLTFVSASTANGTESTLEIRVNDILWQEVSSFYGVLPDERVYITRIADNGNVTVQFGDGKTGARLPTGQENVRAKYRKGIGLPGLVKANQLSQLMTRPLGVKGAVNPLAPTGADDPERRDMARKNAPLKVLTLDRIVSLQDYEDFTRAFAGIGKAQAARLWHGEERLVHITAAAANGGSVDESSDLLKNLITAIDAARHTSQQVWLDSYQSLTFSVEAAIMVDSNYIVDKVLAAVKEALQKAFAFEQREFGQAVTPSEVLAIMQGVEGVIAVDLNTLNGKDPFEEPNFRLTADIAHWDENKEHIKAAELLTINPDGINLREMK